MYLEDNEKNILKILIIALVLMLALILYINSA